MYLEIASLRQSIAIRSRDNGGQKFSASRNKMSLKMFQTISLDILDVLDVATFLLDPHISDA
jgi:hypothetical protein